MKFTISREVLLYNLNQVSRALSTKPQMPILTGIKIDVRSHIILITASNSEISIQAKINASQQKRAHMFFLVNIYLK